jgi:glycosyltransferase involved in cell wall biosynthesis
LEKTLTLVIPAYNEEASLKENLAALISFCETHSFRLIVVNDGSKDGTGAVLSQYASHACMNAIHHKVNRGYGGAIKSGVAAAETDYVITIDADGQHDLEDVIRLFNFLKEKDADMVIGSRKGQKSASAYRSLGKWLIRSLAKILMPIDIYDINSGIKIYDTKLAQKYLHLCPDAMAYSDIIALVFISQRHRVLELPVKIHPRISGKSTISTATAIDTVREILNIVVLFNPMRIFFPLAMLFFLGALSWGLPFILEDRGVSTGAMLGMVTGFIFFLLGLIAEQLSLIRKRNIS